MLFNLLINGPLYSSESSHSALRFAMAAVKQGHVIGQVFFYQDGVSVANRLSNPSSDEFNATIAWSEFAEQHSIDLVVCISSAERRGVMDDDVASENFDFPGNVHAAFRVAGLGALHNAVLTSDRTVTFQ